MSQLSVTTAIPSGVIKEWCIQQPIAFQGERQECANATRGTTEADFQTFCCNGDIIDTSQAIFVTGRLPDLDIRNLVCCGVHGPQIGGLQPIDPNAATQCTEGSPTPLAKLAATNSKNVQPYLVTYTSASFGESTTADFVPTVSPTCLWADTAHGIPMVTTVVAAAHITTLPPPTTDVFGFPIRSGTNYPDDYTAVATEMMSSDESPTATPSEDSSTVTASDKTPTPTSTGYRYKTTTPFNILTAVLLVLLCC